MARLRAMHYGHDAARILSDAMPNVEPAYGQAYTSVVGGLSTLERNLADFGAKSMSGGAIEKETIYAEGNHQDRWSRPGTLL